MREGEGPRTLTPNIMLSPHSPTFLLRSESLERDVPYPLVDGDVLQIGGGLDLAVAIMEAGAAAPASAAAAAAGTCGTTAGAGAGGGTRSKAAAVAMDVGGL
jgi:hypothetical protein